MSADPLPELAPFSLQDLEGEHHHFPGAGGALIAFVKEDCETCGRVAPLLDLLWQAFGGEIDFLVNGQSGDGNRVLQDRHQLSVPLLDDSALHVSYQYDVEIVPTLFLVDSSGRPVQCLEGFVRDEWQALTTEMATMAGISEPSIGWDEYPAWQPGCGSLSADPVTALRLQAELDGQQPGARKVEIGDHEDPFEFMYAQGFTDGLPVIPPTPQRVKAMLAGTRRDAREPIATVPPNMGIATVEKIAINAVMAGCKPEYLPVIIAAMQAACTDEFNIHGVMATTMGATPVMVVNGPIREEIGMNMGMGALGQGNRANATIGRALRLAIRNIGGAVPGGTERSTLGNPMKFTMCFAEWEERSDWNPLHVDLGFSATESVVTLYAMTSGPTLIVDQTSRDAALLAGTIGLTLASAHNPRAFGGTNALIVICPEHVDTFKRSDYSKADVRKRIQEVTAVPVSSLLQDDVSGVGFDPVRAEGLGQDALARQMSKFRSEDDIHIVVAGADAGKFSAMFHGWAIGDVGSMPVSRCIED